MSQVIQLDEVLSLLVPLSEETPGRPTGAMRAEMGVTDNENTFYDTPLTLVLRSGEEDLSLRGTAHRIRKDGDTYTLEEELVLDRKVDWELWRERSSLRGKMLALALMYTKKAERITLILSVYAEGTLEQSRLALEKEDLAASLAPYAAKILALSPLWKKEAPTVEFPYDTLRQGQKDLIRSVWDAVKHESDLFACAPTGIGKTLAVLYPALKALQSGKADQIFYASPKNTLKMQAAAAVEALQSVRTLRTLVLSAKFSLCPEKAEECEKDLCPYFEDFHKKLPDALTYLAAFSCITEKELLAASEHFHLCPFELAKKMLPYCQVVIGDYNHVFDPNRAVFTPSGSGVLLVDEAHNLPARIRENNTEWLHPSDFDCFFRAEDRPSAMLKEHFSALLTLFAKIDQTRNRDRNYFSFDPPEEAGKSVKELIPKVAFVLRDGFGVLSDETRKNCRALFSKLKKFDLLFRGFDENFAVIFPPEGGIKIYPVNPTPIIEKAKEKWKSAIFFSATLQPEEYYFKMLGGKEEDHFLSLSSPFPRDNLFVGLCDVDVSYAQRFATAPKICSIIRTAVSAKEGNYMVFLPSFEYLQLVSQEYKRRFFRDRVLIQERVMTRKKRQDFLSAFEKNRKGTLIGFCVMGGIFSEGVDLKGDSLSGEIIVGTGFPPPSPEAEAESAAFYKKEMDGKSFAYTLPGWSRVLQAAGRVIRSEEDRGFLILCDTRFCVESAKDLFPEHWEGAELIERDEDLRQKLARFWQ